MATDATVDDKRANATKQDVLETLRRTIGYCNSHHDPVQERFESIVDAIIAPTSVVYDYPQRRREMKALFPVLLDERLSGFIPSIALREGCLSLPPSEFLDTWLAKWVRKFVSAWKTLPSERVAEPKGAATDPALIQMALPHATSLEQAREWSLHHNLFMSAENVGGNLLEEYIASCAIPTGWIWCRGQILTAIDFCNHDCTKFVQVKNKSNTENSSSKGFREDHGASVWYRMDAARRNGEIVTHWPELVDIVRQGASPDATVPDDLLNEDDYLAFVRTASEANEHLVTEEEAR